MYLNNYIYFPIIVVGILLGFFIIYYYYRSYEEYHICNILIVVIILRRWLLLFYLFLYTPSNRPEEPVGCILSFVIYTSMYVFCVPIIFFFFFITYFFPEFYAYRLSRHYIQYKTFSL